MQTSAARLIAGFFVAAVGIFGGVLLGAYAEADDAPGGVLIAALLVLGSLGLGIWIALRSAQKQPQ